MLWIKAFHIIFMVTWFAGLFYLPRLFVYHAQSNDAISLERFKVMERKLFAITTLGAILTIGFGVWLLGAGLWETYGDSAWLHIKLALVLALIIYHIFCGKIVKDFKHDKNQRSHVYYRWFNEAPVIALIIIVLLVVIKPTF